MVDVGKNRRGRFETCPYPFDEMLGYRGMARHTPTRYPYALECRSVTGCPCAADS